MKKLLREILAVGLSDRGKLSVPSQNHSRDLSLFRHSLIFYVGH